MSPSTLNNIEQYGYNFQIKVISSLLNNKQFLTNIHDVLTHEYFGNQAHQWIIKEILNYYLKYHTTPTLDVLKVELQKVNNDVLKVSIKEQLKHAYLQEENDSIYVEEEFSNFCRNQQLKKALLNSVDLLNAGDYDSIRHLINNALKSGQDKNIGHEYLKQIESRFREEERNVIPTPWSIINQITQGGLGNGDFGLIFGNPGGGKSWALVALGAFAVANGYNVVHYTLELGETYVGKRYDAFFTGIAVDELKEHRDKVEYTTENLPGKLIIKEYSPGRASIYTIENHIQKLESFDFKPDLVIIDYVDLLSSPRKGADRKIEIDDVYTGTKGLAKELNLPIWSVSQVNRAGAKDDVIEADKAAGSYDKIMITDFAMSLSRKKKDKVDGTGRVHIMKNRYGMDGMSYFAKVDTATGHIELQEEYNEEIHSNNMTEEEVNRKLLKKKFFEMGI